MLEDLVSCTACPLSSPQSCLVASAFTSDWVRRAAAQWPVLYSLSSPLRVCYPLPQCLANGLATRPRSAINAWAESRMPLMTISVASDERVIEIVIVVFGRSRSSGAGVSIAGPPSRDAPLPGASSRI